jgi:hypothetical protein
MASNPTVKQWFIQYDFVVLALLSLVIGGVALYCATGFVMAWQWVWFGTAFTIGIGGLIKWAAPPYQVKLRSQLRIILCFVAWLWATWLIRQLAPYAISWGRFFLISHYFLFARCAISRRLNYAQIAGANGFVLGMTAVTLLSCIALFGFEDISSKNQSSVVEEFLGWLNLALGSLIAIGYSLIRLSAYEGELDETRLQAQQDLASERAWQQTLHALTHALAQNPDFPASAQSLPKLLVETLRLGQRAVVLAYDGEHQQAVVVGKAGLQVESLSRYPLPSKRGIAYRAIMTRQVQNIADVRQDSDYEDGGLKHDGAELSAPFGETASGTALGTITIQRTAYGKFTETAVEQLTVLGDLLWNSARYHQARATGQHTLDQALHRFFTFTSLTEMTSAAVDLFLAEFQPTTVCYFRLSAGGVPLPPIQGGRAINEEFLAAPELREGRSNLTRWIAAWKYEFCEDLRRKESLQTGGYGFGHDFQEQEGLSALAFIPIGASDMRLGVAMLFYVDPHPFGATEKEKLRRLTNELAPHLARAEAFESQYRGFSQPRMDFHARLSESGLGGGTWQLALDRAIKMLEAHGSSDVLLLRQIRHGFANVIRETLMTDDIQISQLAYWRGHSLHSTLSSLSHKLAQSFPQQQVRCQVEPRVEQEAFSMKLSLYLLAAEAIRNALVHGRTTRRVIVTIRRTYNSIELRVEDNGQGFQPGLQSDNAQPKVHPGPLGIFEMGDIAQRLLGATPIDWTGTAPQHGVCLTIRIPTFPDIYVR